MSLANIMKPVGQLPAHTRLVGGQLRDTQPWYKQGWVWFLISFPAASVVAGIFMITLGLSTNNSLVIDDYYKEGKAINQRIARDRAAALLGIHASITLRDGQMRLDLIRTPPADLAPKLSEEASTLASTYVPPTTIEVRWVHVTQDSKDGSATLVPDGMGHWAADIANWPTEGRWRLHVASDDGRWRLISELMSLDHAGPFPVQAIPVEYFEPTAPTLQSPGDAPP